MHSYVKLIKGGHSVKGRKVVGKWRRLKKDSSRAVVYACRKDYSCIKYEEVPQPEGKIFR